MNILRLGSNGPDVITWLQVLARSPQPVSWFDHKGVMRTWRHEWGWPIPTTFHFDHSIEAATQYWQSQRGLVSDGVVKEIDWKFAEM